MDIFKSLKENFSLASLTGSVKAVKNTTQIIERLLTLLQDNRISASARAMLSNLKIVMIDQPNIVSINHFVNHFLLKLNPEDQPIVLKELLEVFHERWKHVDRKTAQVAYDTFNFENKTIAFFGSSLYMQSLIDICVVHQAQCKAVQILGRKDKEGQEQATQILDKKIDVTAVDIYNVGRLKDKIDYLILTSDIIMHQTFISKSGSQILASWAKNSNIPVLVMSDTRKILNKKILPDSVLSSFIGEKPKSGTEIWKAAPADIEIFNYNLEEIDNPLVDSFIFEQKAYDPKELSQEVDKILVTKFL